jgi:cysteine desulfurase
MTTRHNIVIYLDANASEILRPEARAAVIEALEHSGNPASIHGPGRAARRLLETSRTAIAASVGVADGDLVFCSGGTEANVTAIAALAPGRRVLIGATEHDAVRAACPGATILPVHRDGTLDLDGLRDALRADGGSAALVCCMLANNETGVLHPMADIAALCRAHGAWLHVDAVQALGRVRVEWAALGAQSVAVSAHKIGGPKGAGALVLAGGVPMGALIVGGGQERGRRGGTPALPAIAGFAAALDGETPADMAAWRDRIEARAVEAGAVVCGSGERLPNTTCLALPGVKAETQVIALDLAGFAVSAGAACSSGKVTASHVLTAMGYGALAGEAIRVSLPWTAREAAVAAFGDAYAAMAQRLRPRG